jgi:hypothetical protein
MGTIIESVAAATAVLGYDLLNNNIMQSVGYPRVITGIGFCGSNAAGDCMADLIVDGRVYTQLVNIDTGFPNNDEIIPQNIPVPAGSKIILRVTDAASTNPINVIVKTAE